MRLALLRLALLFALIAATPISSKAIQGMPSLAEVMADEATLRDVEFFDGRLGWAVGDRGVLLRTDDGGKHWQRIETPTTASLHSVSFIDADRGWAAGGQTRPYTHETEAVLLQTKNGGRSWELVSHTPLPTLRVVKFFDAKNGVAAGVGSAFNPSGVFVTDDGGRGWHSLAAPATRSWSGGDFVLDSLGDLAGVVVGSRGQAARLTGRDLAFATGFGDRRAYRAASMIDPANGWMVGDGGLVNTTNDGGRSWFPAASAPSELMGPWFDWRTIDARDKHVWIAGSPGSCVLRTSDSGTTWNTFPTGISTPLNAVEFIDERHGWMVGDLGVILVTNDGGQTWRPQRGKGRRTAIAMVIGSANQLPAELLAINAAAEGHRSVVVSPLLPEEHADSSATARRVSQAAILCGADSLATGWRVPIEAADHSLSTEALLSALENRSDGKAYSQLIKRLAVEFQTHRPEVIVTPFSEPGSDGAGIAELLTRATLEAIERASEPPPAETRLAPWRVQRVIAAGAVASTPTGTPNGGDRLAVGDFSRLLGATPAQWCRDAWGLLTDAYQPSPNAYRWQTLAGRPAGPSRHGDLLSDLNSPRGSDTRRSAATVPTDQLEQLRRLAQKHRNMQQLLDRAQGDPAWAGQVVDLTGGLDASSGAELLHQLAEGYREAGRLELAAETLYLLARRYPGTPLADAALLRLIHYYASSERSHADVLRAAANVRGGSDTLANISSNASIVPLGEEKEPTATPEDRAERATKLIDYLKTARPTLFADPQIRFAEAASERTRGFGAAADRITLLLSKQAIADDWRRAATAERWLSKPEGLPPEKPIATCRYSARRPKLDGNLNDPIWQKAEPIRLQSQENQREEGRCTVWLACDDEFLYLAAEANAEVPSLSVDKKARRQRDANLNAFDRLSLRFDIDRDYATAYELTIDQRGWTHDSLWGDRHWNPRWYVAAKADSDRDANVWRVEAAVALAEMADPAELSRAAWAVSIERLRPGHSAMSWTGTSTETASPEAFGLLLFD